MCCSSLCHIVLHCNALTNHIAAFSLFFHRLEFCWCCCCSTWIGCITCLHLISYTHIYLTIHISYIILYWIDLPLLVFSLFLTGWTFVVVINAARWMYHLHLLKLTFTYKCKHLPLLTLQCSTFSFAGFCRCACCCSALDISYCTVLLCHNS